MTSVLRVLRLALAGALAPAWSAQSEGTTCKLSWSPKYAAPAFPAGRVFP